MSVYGCRALPAEESIPKLLVQPFYSWSPQLAIRLFSNNVNDT